MRDTLPEMPWVIINLARISSGWSHCTCYYKNGNDAIYFDSYGDAKPPLELVRYLNVKKLEYTTDSIQKYDDPPICDHLCLEVLRRLTNRENWKHIYSIINSDKYVFEIGFKFNRFGNELSTDNSSSGVSETLLEAKLNELQVKNEAQTDEKIKLLKFENATRTAFDAIKNELNEKLKRIYFLI